VIGRPIFVYGTLLDPVRLARVSGDPRLARRARPASLAGHARALLRGSIYPTLVPARGGMIEGALIRPSAPALRALSAYEGAAYSLVPVRVVAARGPMNARAWIVPRWRADTKRLWERGPGCRAAIGS
jgi:hypothetical protein